MKVLHLNSNIDGGANRAICRLHKGLQGIGIDSQMLVPYKIEDDYTILGTTTRIGKIIGETRRLLDQLPLRLYPKREPPIFSPAILPDKLPQKIANVYPNVIHLHWILNGFMRIETLRHFNKPIIWTLHDMWPFTGGCHYDENCGLYKENCGRCPALNSTRENDLSYKVLKRKKRAWGNVNLVVITPSHWLAQCAKSSSLFCDRRIEVIPHGLDLKKFRPIDKNIARDLLSLPRTKKFILFGAIKSASDKRKGFQFLQPALQELANNRWNDKADLIIFGSPEPYNPSNLGLKTHYMSYLYDDISLVLLYSAADVMVVPSVQEAFGQIASEAMACGTPVVAFHTTGLIDIIEHMKTGYLAKPFDSSDLANGITWILSDNERWQTLSQQARQKVENEFALENVAQQYASLYEEILGHEK